MSEPFSTPARTAGSSRSTGAGGSEPSMPASMRGAVDLGAIGQSALGGGAPGALGQSSGGHQFTVEVTEQSFPDLVQISAEVPVVVAMYAGYSPQSRAVVDTLDRLVAAYVGRMLLATADVEKFPQIAQAFGAQGVPEVVALVKGQPVPLFNGDLGESDTRRYLEELLKLAAAHGVQGTLGDADAQPEAPPLPPLHQEALDAIDRGDLAAAEAAYRAALTERPADNDAKAGLAQVGLLQRTEAMNAENAEGLRTRAAENPDDVQTQLEVADLDLLGGHVEDALSRIVRFIATHPGADHESAREIARLRLLELFEVVGGQDPRVRSARQALARALF
ncbi:tetratricopeptide repeat protein [Psychromicrobium xiongbiense]|uniref:tetratricopeptide repeat protein n=1 Tax=Psychromicrobium xiongbiense TaxID=3051184 RepID=UPI0025578849|nr:tetratricopeptide repeat protein [Psychromicrobium sp. YIM S02556]